MIDTKEINKELNKFTKIQQEYLDKINELNKEKSELICKKISILDEKKLKRISEIGAHLRQLQNVYNYSSGECKNRRVEVMKIYKKISKRLFYKTMPLNINSKICYNSEKRPYYWNDKPIAWGINGIGILEYYPSWSRRTHKTDDKRINTFQYIDDIILFLKSNPQIRKCTIFKDEIKQSQFEKLYDIITTYQTIEEHDFNLSITLSIPITTIIEEASESEEVTPIKLKSTKVKEIERLQVASSNYGAYIESFDSHKYSDEDKLKIDFNSDYRHLHYYICQLPEKVFEEIEKHLDLLEKTMENNKQVYQKLMKEFGHLLMFEAL